MKKEIIYNVVNSLLAGSLVMLGAISTGNLSMNSICLAIVAGLIVAVSKFRDFWISKEKIYKHALFQFI
jgi:hypothetical protein